MIVDVKTWSGSDRICIETMVMRHVPRSVDGRPTGDWTTVLHFGVFNSAPRPAVEWDGVRRILQWRRRGLSMRVRPITRQPETLPWRYDGFNFDPSAP